MYDMCRGGIGRTNPEVPCKAVDLSASEWPEQRSKKVTAAESDKTLLLQCYKTQKKRCKCGENSEIRLLSLQWPLDAT